MPRGLYVVSKLDAPEPGRTVWACIPAGQAADSYGQREYLPRSSACPSGLAAVIKMIAAGPGDSVAIDSDGTRVNGLLLQRSRVYDTDSNGRPIEHLPIGWRSTLAAGEFFLIANHLERSLDSRYYGPVALTDLRGAAAPLITY